MGYVNENLGQGEEVLFATELNSVFMWIFGIAGTVLGILTLGSLYGAGFLLYILVGFYWLSVKTSEFAVTNKKVFIKYGILTVTSLEINLGKIEAIAVNQSLAGRICGYGTIVISGTGGTKQVFNFINQPIQFRKSVSEAIEKYGK